MQSILHHASKAEISEEPFPHIVVHNALEGHLYESLAREYPAIATLLDGRPLPEDGTCGASARDIVSNGRISLLWREFIAYHVSQQFYGEVMALFGDHIRRLHPDLETRLGKPLEALQPNVRFHEACRDIALECQFICTAPNSRPWTIRGPHLDRAVALYAGLFYCRLDEDDTPGGDLELYRYAAPQRYVYESRQVPDRYVEQVKTIRYQKNTLVFFPHSPDSVHAVSTRAATTFPRLHVNFVGELPMPVYDVSRQHIVIPTA